MGRRYLTEQEAIRALSRGKKIEAFIGGFEYKNKKTIKWISIYLERGNYIGELWEAFDEGDKNFLDVYSFQPINAEYNEPAMLIEADNLDGFSSAIGCEPLNYVNHGVLQDLYGDYLEAIT